MDVFCVRTKPHHFRGNYNRIGDQKEEEANKKKGILPLGIVQIERRLREDLARKKKPGKQSLRRSRAMSQPPQHTQSPPGEEPRCPRPCCAQNAVPSTPGNPSPHQGVSPPTCSQEAQHQENVRREAVPLRQIYIHPYSIEHQRFAVVDYSMTCHGRHPDPYPVCYMAVAPNAATPRDIETALADRPGLVVMARLTENNELASILNFSCIRTLCNASLQLEIRDRQ
ncbi:hypothetical protein F5Y10DRAFT_263752 [Nemania abortiva]|nr:hypothetical protein F5Y10DRAFT_263752 [Nemania abortiva]